MAVSKLFSIVFTVLILISAATAGRSPLSAPSPALIHSHVALAPSPGPIAAYSPEHFPSVSPTPAPVKKSPSPPPEPAVHHSAPAHAPASGSPSHSASSGVSSAPAPAHNGSGDVKKSVNAAIAAVVLILIFS